MSAKTPIRGVFDSGTATGLAEFQSGEFIALTHGGLGASLSIGSAGQVLKVNSGGTAIEFGSVESFSDSSVGGSYGLKFRVSTSSSANYEAMRIAQNGYVSLGGQTPDAHFHIEKLTPELRVQSTNANLGQGGTVCTYSHHTSDPTTPTGLSLIHISEPTRPY